MWTNSRVHTENWRERERIIRLCSTSTCESTVLHEKVFSPRPNAILDADHLKSRFGFTRTVYLMADAPSTCKGSQMKQRDKSFISLDF